MWGNIFKKIKFKIFTLDFRYCVKTIKLILLILFFLIRACARQLATFGRSE